MKQVQIAAYGMPESVAQCVDVEDVGVPDVSEVVFEVLAFPINPADIRFCRGVYRTTPPLPAVPGAECVGRVLRTGAGVTSVRAGDLVINLMRENWAQRRRVSEQDVIRLPGEIDLRQAAMVRINPPTAYLLLKDFIALRPDDWIIQNVANSAVGRLVISIAKKRGVRTINVTRRDDVFSELNALGADICLLDGDDLAERASRRLNGAPIRLGFDAVGGESTKQMGQAICDEGVLVSYGSMSYSAPTVNLADLSFRGITHKGFMLGRALAKRDRAGVQAIYDELIAQILDGTIYAPVEAVYPIEKIQEALAHSQRPAHGGKILVAPNGMI